MFRFLFKILILLVIGVLIYNYFFGNSEERTQAKAVVSEIKDAGRAVGNLLNTEKTKFDNGKYDKALDKMSMMLQKMKSSSKDASTNQEITQLEAEKNSIETKLDKLSTQKNVKASEQKDLLTRMEQLLEKAEKVAGTLEE
ncbi:MAG: hypothetical protein IPQ18_10085 [Saprospiraceae bacterium]|jgi:predicted negative regulator of RcsB-dependent stress response|nr:hypothetical protein [Saprospiraceae bacterium]MBL0293818.1 hypothetical protein [Saprospiraceae bacterium]